MKAVGVICEYNPLHLGHKKQLELIRGRFGADTAIVCLMSGSFVQRGAPAIFDKSLRAKAAVLSGADLVLELPVTAALSSAEGFAAGGVRILSEICGGLCFGTESGEADALMDTARGLLSAEFSVHLKERLETGVSFPAARQAAAEKLGIDAQLLSRPNDILGVEYCKAILAQGSTMEPLPIHREGSYHASKADLENPSATAVRELIASGKDWAKFVPAYPVFENAPRHTLQAGERAILSKLRTMTEAEFEALPYGSEGLWRKFMAACRTEASVEDILAATKSKRYTRTRLDRMLMCAFLGIDRQTLERPAPYVRVLAFDDTGRAILNRHRESGRFRNAGEAAEDPYWDLEQRCGDLYGLFCADGPEPAGLESKRRIFYKNK